MTTSPGPSADRPLPDLDPAALDMQPHPEGGFYRETFRSTQRVTLADGRVRSAGTAIYYLLEPDRFSQFHRIPACEVWHHYAGGPLLLHQLGVGTVRLDEKNPQAFPPAPTHP